MAVKLSGNAQSRIDKLKGQIQDGSLRRGSGTASSGASSSGTSKGMTLSTSAKERLDSLKQELSSGALRDPSRDVRVTWKDVARVPSPVKDFDVGIGIKGWKAYKAQKTQPQTAEEEKNWAEKLIGYLGTSSPDGTLPMANVTQVTENYRRDTSYQEPTDSWNSEERRIFGYLWASDQEAALKYASDVNDAIAQGKRQEKAAAVRQDAANGFWKGLGHSAAAVGGGALGLADYLNAVAEYSARGKISEQEDLTPFAYSQEVTGGVSEHLNEKYGTVSEAVPIIGGKGLGDVYGLGMSVAQSGAAGYTGGQLGTLVQFFGSAAASGTQEAKQRGADDQSALMYGTMTGIAEGLAEEIGVDNLFKVGSSATMRELILNIAKQGAAEGLEEGITSVLNNFSDQLVMGDKSNFYILVQDYMRSGWDEEEAKKQAWIDMAEDVAYDILGGFVSGTVHAAPVTAYQTVSENRAYSNTYGSSAAELVQEGLESEEGSLSRTLAEKYQQKLDQGGTLTGAEIHRLVNANEKQILKEDANAIRQAAADRLTELGEISNVMGLADVLTKRVTKQKLTTKEKKLFRESQYGQQVAHELDPTSIESGDTSSVWTRNIQTSRVMADVYGQQEAEASEMETETPVAAASLENQAAETQNNAVPAATAEESQVVDAGYRVAEDGNAARIASISSTDGRGGMQVKLEDGSVVDAAEVGYVSEGEAVLYEAVAKLGADAEISNILINTYRKEPGGVSAEEYAAGMLEAFSYGRYNIPRQQMADNRDVMALTEMQRNGAYELGRVFGKDLVQSRQANAQRAKVIAKTKQLKQKAGEKTLGRKPKVHFERQGRNLSDVQETALTQMEQLSVLLGTEFQVFESYTNEDGARVYRNENGVEKPAPNGWYDPGTGVIHVDLNAGAGGEGTMAFTVAHELTHFIRQWSPEKFDLLAETVFSTVYAEKEIPVMDLIREQQRKAERSGRELSLEEAYEEAVADAMEGILTSGNVVQMMTEVKQRDVSLWEKIREWFKDLAEDIKKLVKAYEKYKPDSKEGRAVASMKEMLPIIEGYYADALLEASENYQAAEGQKNTTPEDGRKFSYAGENARTANGEMRNNADSMEQQGAENETIRQRTGWFRGMDGKWRFEIDDSQMEISEHISNYMRLGDLLRHDALYEAYPDIADIDVVFQSLKEGAYGSYDPRFDSINLSYQLKSDPVGLKDALIHEIQHAIQQREGFTKGATAEGWERKRRAGFDSRRTADIRKARETEQELRRIQEEEPEFYRDMLELDAMTPDLPRGEVNWDTLEKIEEDPPEWQRYDARREELEAKYGDTKVWDMNDLLYQREKAARNMGRSGVELYYDTAGEIEARDVANRRQKTPEQRKNSPPRLGNEDTVFAEGNGISADYVGKTSDGIEVYETSDETKKLTWADRKKVFLQLMRQEYRGRTAKFVRNGHAYYARFEYRDVSKNIYGDESSDQKGHDAKINVGADGNIFELVENSKYLRSEPERGKDHRMHRGVNYWDYFVKTVQIDGSVFDLTANVRKKADGQYVYVIEMHENKEIEPSSPEGSQKSGLNGVPNSSTISINNSEAEVKRKLSARDSNEDIDSAYMEAVNSGDMKTAQKMVDEAAKRWGAYLNNSEANEVFRQSGEVRTFYHGTNTGDFTVFDKSLLGNSSGDLGWFGKGFYFAFSADEANVYGSRVIHAYLKMKNPYDYSQLYKFKGSDHGSSQYARFAWLYNITKQFPDIVTDQRIYAYPYDAEEGKAVSWNQLARWMDRIEKDAKFSVAQVELSNGDTAWELRADPKQESFTNEDGETFTWTEYGMRQLFATEMDAKEPINQIGAYLVNVMGVEPVPRRTIESIDFSEAVQRAGYDGILQSPSGDEAVVFDSSQIKLSDPVTYDDSGNVIPISKRFDNSNSDIRYSARDPLQEKTISALEKQNAKLSEDVQQLKELVKLQGTLTGGKLLKASSVEAAARMLKKKADSKGNTKELAGLLTGFYDYILRGEELTWEGVKEAAEPAAAWLLENRKQYRNAYAQEILTDLKGRSISLNESQKAEAASYQGSYGGYRKMLFGSVKLTKDGLPLDDAWQELSSLYPGVFDKDMNANDMPEALAVIIDRLKNTREDAFAYSEDEFLASMIREVYDSYWNVSTLYTVADKKQKQIDLLKGQHYEQMQQLKQEHRNSMANIRDSRNKGDYRRKIRKVIRDLDKILNRGDKKRNVKEGMQDFAYSALTAFETLFTDYYSEEDMVRNGVGTDLTPDEQRWLREAQEALDQLENLPGGYEGYQQRQELEPKLKSKLQYRMNKLKDVFVRERARLNRTQVSEVLGKLADSYRALEVSEDAYIQQAYHENVYHYLLMLKEDVGGTTVRDMTLGQLEELYKGFTMVMTTVRKANRMFAENLKETRDVLAQRVIREVRTAGGKGRLRTKAGEKANTFSWNNEKPVYAFERIGSDTFTTLFNNIRKGQDGWAVDLQEADAFRRKLYTKYNHSKWNFEKEYSFTSSSGLKFTLNLEQIMSLYAYSKREQAYDHLMKGGFVFDGKTEMVVSKNGFKRTYLKKDATAYNLSPELLEDIISLLTPEQKVFTDEMQAYLSDTMGEKGNEVSMQLYGIKLFKEKFYFPLRSAGQYMERAKEADLKKEQGQISIVNSGFAKATKINASNPVVLSGFMQTWAEHVNEMSMYHSFVLPMEDFRRVYNFSSLHVEEQGSVSVNSVLQNAYGEACVKYIDQLYRDLNGGALVDNTTGIINKLMNLFKKGAVFASASVTIQQASAVARAAALVDVKHFIGPKVDKKRHKALWDEVKKYAPVAFIKEMGYFDTNMGRSAVDLLTAEEYRGFAENALAMIKDEDYRDEFLSKGPALADELTWCVIWDAVKRETKARNPKLDPRGEEFLKLAGERFSDVIDKTQVYDSVLSRSANMRSKDTGMKMATAFMAEPTTSINMIEDALRKGKRGDRRYCRRAIGAVLASVLLNSALVSLVYASRDDDEEKTFAEKYVGALTGSLVDGINPATYIPFIKDIMSIVQGYDVERSDMAVISDVWNAVQKLKNDDVSLYSKVEAIGGSVAQIFGLPVKNIMRDLRSVYQALDTVKNGEKATGAGFLYAMQEAVTGKAVPNAQQLYEAKVAGDAAHTARVTARYEDEDSANAAVRSVIRDRFLEGEIDTREALRQLVLYSGMDGSEAHWTMDAWEYRKETGSDEGYSKFNDFHEAVRSGKDLDVVVESYISNGVTPSTLSKAITEEFKPVYMEMSQAERDAFREKLVDAYVICGMERDTAAMKLKTFEWQAEGIDTDSFSVIQDWEDNCQPVGIDKRTYYDAYLFYREAGEEDVSYSKVIECMPYINELPLTAEQKTALALCWWSKSTVKKYKKW